MQQFTIPIGTSGDGNLNLADGLPLFPVIGTSRAGISNTARSNVLFDGAATILFSRTKVSAFYEFFVGVLGPAIAFEFPNAQVNLNNPERGGGQVLVDFGQNQQMVAGLGVGMAVGAGLKVTQQFYLPESWFSPWKFSWRTAFELSLEFEVDFIRLLLNLIALLLGESGSAGLIAADRASKLQRFLNVSDEFGFAESFKFYGYSSDRLGPGKQLNALPTVVIPFDFAKAIPGLANFIKNLAAVVGECSLGPMFLIQMPVSLEVDSFTVRGGQGESSTATYGPVTYEGPIAMANGDQRFTTSAQRFATNVSYRTGFEVGLSVFFKIQICKVFSFQRTGPSLNLLHLLLAQVPTYAASGSVSTNIQSGCVLVPRMSIAFSSSGSDPNFPPEPNTAVADVSFKGEVFLDDPWDDPPTQIQIRINPPVAGFPTSCPINTGDKSSQFEHTFGNQCVISGDMNHPGVTISPSPSSPYQSFSIRASLPNSSRPCADWEVTAPVKLRNRILQATLVDGTAGDGPVFSPTAGAQLNADPSQPPGDVKNFATVKYLFPYAPGAIPVTATVLNVYLVDEERRPHKNSNVVIRFDSGASASLFNAAKQLIVPMPNAGATFRIEWLSSSPPPPRNYSNLFYLILDAGCQFGQTEFWLNVWNWL
jgi:hypothetical protein